MLKMRQSNCGIEGRGAAGQHGQRGQAAASGGGGGGAPGVGAACGDCGRLKHVLLVPPDPEALRRAASHGDEESPALLQHKAGGLELLLADPDLRLPPHKIHSAIRGGLRRGRRPSNRSRTGWGLRGSAAAGLAGARGQQGPAAARMAGRSRSQQGHSRCPPQLSLPHLAGATIQALQEPPKVAVAQVLLPLKLAADCLERTAHKQAVRVCTSRLGVGEQGKLRAQRARGHQK